MKNIVSDIICDEFKKLENKNIGMQVTFSLKTNINTETGSRHLDMIICKHFNDIVIIAREISENLKTAIEGLDDVQIFEYKLSFKLEPIL